MRIFETGFNFSQDGPGNRLILHMQGCNFCCPWCSNPEGMDAKATAKEMTVEEVLHLCERSRPMFFSGGGVTFTGGECTLQWDDLHACLKGLKERGINTAVESNGSHPRLLELSPLIDHMILDLKQPNEELHRLWTGHSATQTKENIRSLLLQGKSLLVRIPLINHVNTDPEPFVAFFKTCEKTNLCVEVLQYHEYGKNKWRKPYVMKDAFVTQMQVEAMENALKDLNISLIHT